MKKLFIIVLAVMPLLATSNYPKAKADEEGKVVKNIKRCFGKNPWKVTAEMYFDKDTYKGKPLEK